MKRLILMSIAALLFMGETANAACVYQGVAYSEGARVCMHRTMFMCRGEQWIKTAERCWEKYATQDISSLHVDERLLSVLVYGRRNVTTNDAKGSGESCTVTIAYYEEGISQ